MSTSTSCSSYTCPVYGNLPNANLKGLPPIPLCCFGQGYRPCQPLPSINLEKEELCICDILPMPEGFNLSYLLVNLPTYIALLLSAIPRWLACMIYDVGIALRGIVLSIDDFISAILDLFLAIFIGFAEGASFGGCYIVAQIANFLFHANIKLPNFGNNCPFCYTLNKSLQSTLETIGFALGTPIGLINLIIGLLLDSMGLILCYLANLTVNFGICIWLFSFQFSFTPFSFLSAITPFNCGCILGQLGDCPVLNLVYGCSVSTTCNITNSNCQCLATQGSGNQQELACQSLMNSCVSTVSQWASTQYNECNELGKGFCDKQYGDCLNNAKTCYSTALSTCESNYNSCVSQASTQYSDCRYACTHIYKSPSSIAECLANCDKQYIEQLQRCQNQLNQCETNANYCYGSAQACCQKAYASCLSQVSTYRSECKATVKSTFNSLGECCVSVFTTCQSGASASTSTSELQNEYNNCVDREYNVVSKYQKLSFNCTGKFTDCGG